MSSVAVVAYTSSSGLRPPIPRGGAVAERRLLYHSTIGDRRRRQFSSITAARAFPPPHFFRLLSFRIIRCFQQGDAPDSSQEPDQFSDLVFGAQEEKFTGKSGPFLAKLAIALGIAVTVTVVSMNFKRPDLGIQCLADGLPSALLASSPPGFTFKAFGYKLILPEYAPGWVYFWLLMAAGCGLFISEEALNIWLGIGEDRAMSISQVVQKYGNLSGFVERFSLGVRNPTAFLAGAMGVSPDCFFAGVCCGGLITLPVQLAIGFLLRERPVFALATVATVVGIWTVFPYAVAALTALFLYLRGRQST